jgi:hypothetical protein
MKVLAVVGARVRVVSDPRVVALIVPAPSKVPETEPRVKVN